MNINNFLYTFLDDEELLLVFIKQKVEEAFRRIDEHQNDNGKLSIKGDNYIFETTSRLSDFNQELKKITKYLDKNLHKLMSR
ncbi:MAG: hypothetical protein JW807_12740 [Spirochaetes bacterium]|nr:hypothetical protein [Spirochaetota bacterium]